MKRVRDRVYDCLKTDQENKKKYIERNVSLVTVYRKTAVNLKVVRTYSPDGLSANMRVKDCLATEERMVSDYHSSPRVRKAHEVCIFQVG